MAMEVRKSVCLERLEQILPAAYDNYLQLVTSLDLMIYYRIDTLQQLNRVAAELDKRHHSGNIVKLVGSATGVVGSLTAAAGVALAPITMGAGMVLLISGTAVMTAGSATALGAHVTEKVLEKVDLEKVQQAVDRDKAQCERVSQLWKGFESYCTDVINTIALADPSEDSDVESLQTWVQVAMEEVKSPIALIAETFHKAYSSLSNPSGQKLCNVLEEMARIIIGDPWIKLQSVVSKIPQALFTLSGTAAFLVICAILVGNLFVFLKTLINMHEGSPSKVAKGLREKSKELQQELDTWLDSFGKPTS